MSKHTPGPWKVDGKSDYFRISAQAHGGQYTVIGISRGAIPSDADAQLLASAPELLEFAKAYLRGYKYDGGNDRWTDSELRDMAAKAVAKAEGGK